jgi:hypothetical protein
LTFAPLAWLKLQFFCHIGDTEIGGFGVSAEGNPLYIEEFVTVRQQATAVTVRFEDAAVADWFDRGVDQGLAPARFARVWLHTHPGASVTPSGTDEETFDRVFGRCDWSVMFILGRTGQTYARLAFTAGPGGELLLPVQVDWSAWPEVLSAEPGRLQQQQVEQWQQEYAANVEVLPDLLRVPVAGLDDKAGWDASWWDPEPWGAEWDRAFDSLVEEDRKHELGF